jgi:hypothetical protein
MRTNVRATSRDAYRRINSDGTVDYNTRVILEFVASAGKVTRRQIEDGTGLRPNQVSGRVNEMLSYKILDEDAHKMVDPITGFPEKRVYVRRSIRYVEQELPL